MTDFANLTNELNCVSIYKLIIIYLNALFFFFKCLDIYPKIQLHQLEIKSIINMKIK